MDNRIKYIISQFSAKDMEFLNHASAFDAPVYCAVEEIDGLPAGFIEASPQENDIYINIGIVPKRRGNKLAKKLFSGLLSWFVMTKYDGILWNAHENNVASIDLALKLGFKEFYPPNQHKHNKMRFFALGK